MFATATATAPRRDDAHPAFLQRKCGCGRTCGGCDKKKKPLDRSAETSTRPAIPPIVDDVLRSPGQPLAGDTQAMMESRFQHDFSGVRVHTGAHAAESARAVNARAYTVGSDIVFNSGAYQPRSSTGQRLLAHELTHVVQQSGGVHRSAQGISSPDDDTERAADRAADAVMSGGSPSVASGGAGVLHREPPEFGDNWQGNWAICKFDFMHWGDWSKAVDCCGKIDPLGSGCLSDLEKLRKGLPGGTPGGGKGTQPGCFPGLPGCPPAIPPPERKCIPPETPSFYGGCCKPGATVSSTGMLCLPMPKPKPKPEGPEKPPEKPPEQPPAAKPIPPASELAFQFDKPGIGSTTLKTSLTSDGTSAYEALLKILKDDTTLKVTLVGRASPEGSLKYNRELGGRRASAVADALIADGISASRIDDVPGGIASGEQLRKGVFTTGEVGSTGKTDRKVRAVFFR